LSENVQDFSEISLKFVKKQAIVFVLKKGEKSLLIFQLSTPLLAGVAPIGVTPACVSAWERN